MADVTNLRPMPASMPAAPPKKPDPTNALRQRRHKAKRKAAAVTPPVTAPPVAPAQKPNPIKANVTPSRRNNAAAKAVQRQAGTALSVGVVAAILTTLSLAHLARGIGTLTGASAWEAWSMAIAIDLGFVALELCQLATVSEKVRREVSRYAKPAIIATLIVSAGMNVLAFAGKYVTVDPAAMTAAAIILGVAIPALVYVLVRVGAALATDCHSRA